MHPLPSDLRTLRLILNGLTGLGPVSARRLQEAFGGDLRRALSADAPALRQVKGLTAPMVASLLRRDFDHTAELERASALNFRILHEADELWPDALRQLWDAPLVLYLEGAAVPNDRTVAIIGSRHCTPYGAGLARSLARAQDRFGTVLPDGLRAALATPQAPEPSAYFLHGLSPAAEFRSTFAATSGWPARVRLVREHLLPSRAYMRATYPACPSWLLPAAYVHRVLRGAPRWCRRRML